MLGKVKRIHFIGIGGIGMSGIAQVLNNLGFTVTGSDLKIGDTVRMLRKQGIKVYKGHRQKNIGTADVVVYSSAVPEDNIELIAAQSKKIPTIPRAEMLAELMRMKVGVAVAGTHGKTTTTSFVASVLDAGGLDPTVVIGGRLIATGRNYRLGESEYLVVEADESDASFLHLSPSFVLITNIEREHLDFYHDIEEIKSTFLKFISKIPFWGSVIIGSDHPVNNSIIPAIDKRVVTYGIYNDAQVKGEDIEWSNWGTRFRVRYQGKSLGKVEIPIPGRHNIQNCLSAIAIGIELGVSFKKIKSGLSNFPGVHRRMEKIGKADDILFFDDYGHHPTEIASTLSTMRNRFPEKRIIAVFQPHRYTRSYHLIDEFARSFYSCDLVLVTDIYPAGEKPIPGINGQIVAERIDAEHTNVDYVGDLKSLNKKLQKVLQSGDVVITLGAGSITKVGRKLCRKLQR